MSFLEMPPELRNAIYELALPQTVTLSLSGDPTTPSLLQVNHQIRAEATPLYRPTQITAHIQDDQVNGPVAWAATQLPAAMEEVTGFCLRFSTSDALIATNVPVANEGPLPWSLTEVESILSAIMKAGFRVADACIHLKGALEGAGVPANSIRLETPRRSLLRHNERISWGERWRWELESQVGTVFQDQGGEWEHSQEWIKQDKYE